MLAEELIVIDPDSPLWSAARPYLDIALRLEQNDDNYSWHGWHKHQIEQFLKSLPSRCSLVIGVWEMVSGEGAALDHEPLVLGVACEVVEGEGVEAGFKMRVIGGLYRSRTLQAPPGAATRPRRGRPSRCRRSTRSTSRRRPSRTASRPPARATRRYLRPRRRRRRHPSRRSATTTTKPLGWTFFSIRKPSSQPEV